MTALDPPAVAARRQWAIDRIVEDLIGWGLPLDGAEGRAARLLEHATAAGYRLPTAIADVPPPALGSTAEGRAAARAFYEAARRQADARRQRGPGAPHTPDPIAQDPPEAHSGAEGVSR
jgi:hypothetical protein